MWGFVLVLIGVGLVSFVSGAYVALRLYPKLLAKMNPQELSHLASTVAAMRTSDHGEAQ